MVVFNAHHHHKEAHISYFLSDLTRFLTFIGIWIPKEIEIRLEMLKIALNSIKWAGIVSPQ